MSSGRLASAVWLKNELIAVGFNQKKTHPVQKRFGDNPHRQWLHAETDAIVRAARSLSPSDFHKAILYVARAKRGERRWEQGMAKPCSGCVECAEFYGLGGVFYTLDGEDVGYLPLWR